MGIWRLLVRLGVGALLVGHGTQKLFGWFDGEGVAGTAKTFEKVGLRPGRANAVAAAISSQPATSMIPTGSRMALQRCWGSEQILLATFIWRDQARRPGQIRGRSGEDCFSQSLRRTDKHYRSPPISAPTAWDRTFAE